MPRYMTPEIRVRFSSWECQCGAILAPFGREGGTAPHLMSCLFMIIESAPKAGAAMQSAAAIRVFLMVPPVSEPALGRTGLVDLTRPSRPQARRRACEAAKLS